MTSMPSTYYEKVENEVVFRRSQLMCLLRAQVVLASEEVMAYGAHLQTGFLMEKRAKLPRYLC